MKHNTKYIAFVIIITAVILAAGFAGLWAYRSAANIDYYGESIPRQNNGRIFLYGEEHSNGEILEKELELWNEYYHDNNMKDLFVELPYYTAEFLNIWMRSENDDILNLLYLDWDGTAIHSEEALNFYKQIKADYPETVFHGTDVGHQYNTTGKRYLEYLRENGFGEDSAEYRLTEENIEQGKYYYRLSDNDYRENKMTENFIREFEGLNNTDVMGIYGAAHTVVTETDYATDSVPCLASRLNERYGGALYTKNLRLAEEAYSIDAMQIGGKEYTASYFGKTDLSAVLPEYQSREFWRIEDAYDDFKDCPVTDNVLPYDNYPMEIEAGQIFAIIYTKSDGSVRTEYHRSDGSTWRGSFVTEEFTIY